MRKVVIAFAAAAVLTLASAASVLAASPNHANEPTPGAANCHGQAAAFVAQSATNLGLPKAHGFAGIAHWEGFTVKEAQAITDVYCAGGI